MILPSELEILKNYDLYNGVSLTEYFTDFIIKNPLNYPFTSWFMRNLRTSGYSLRNVLNRTSVSDRLSNNQSINEECLSKLMLLENDTGFNMVMLPSLHQSLYLQVIQLNPLIVSIRNSDFTQYELLLDQYLNDIIIYDTKNWVKILSRFTKKFSNLEDFKNHCNCEIYYFDIKKETGLSDTQKSCLIANTIAQSSVYDELIKESNITKFCKNSIYHEHNTTNIFKEFQKNEYCYQCFKNQTSDSTDSLHYDNVDQSSLFDIIMN